MKRKLGLTSLLLLMLLLAGCGTGEEAHQTDTPAPNEVVDIKQLVHDYSIGKLTDEQASITSEQLIVTKSDESKVVYDLPKDEFFVSFAPYLNQTHPCANHSLTGCQGELADEEITVKITDKSGKVILDEVTQTQANGFIDFWLPRNETYQITITDKNAQTATLEFSTFEGDNTCMTTMQLM